MTAGIVARWATHTEPAGAVGMLAVIVDTPAGARLVIAQRTPTGDWAPTRTLDATAEAVRMIRRQHSPDQMATGGGLW